MRKNIPITEAVKRGYTNYVKRDSSFSPTGPIDLRNSMDAGIYKVEVVGMVPQFTEMTIASDQILKFEDSRYNSVMDAINNFWSLREKYDNAGFTHKRGVLMYGNPGTGKSVMLKSVMSTAVENGNIVLVPKSVYGLCEAIGTVREIEPDRPIICVLEDLDGYTYDEQPILELFDGPDAVGGVLYLATTNYPDRLSPRLLRPGRFDEKVEVGNPPAEGRKAYFVQKLKDLEESNIDELVAATDDFSFAELREFIVSHTIYGKSVEDSIEAVKGKGHRKFRPVHEAVDRYQESSDTFRFPISSKVKLMDRLVIENRESNPYKEDVSMDDIVKFLSDNGIKVKSSANVIECESIIDAARASTLLSTVDSPLKCPFGIADERVTIAVYDKEVHLL